MAFRERRGGDNVCMGEHTYNVVTHIERMLNHRALYLQGSSGLLDNFPIQQKDRLFCKAIFLILYSKTSHLIVEWRSYWAI